jgi:hypothetical protein
MTRYVLGRDRASRGSGIFCWSSAVELMGRNGWIGPEAEWQVSDAKWGKRTLSSVRCSCECWLGEHPPHRHRIDPRRAANGGAIVVHSHLSSVSNPPRRTLLGVNDFRLSGAGYSRSEISVKRAAPESQVTKAPRTNLSLLALNTLASCRCRRTIYIYIFVSGEVVADGRPTRRKARIQR